MRYYISALCMLMILNTAQAQHLDKPSFDELHALKCKTNRTGMSVLGGWAAVNIAGGAVGYFTAKDQEWKAFHGMNVIWGVVNLGFAGFGYWGAAKERQLNLSCDDMLHKYESTKRLFLLNAGLDGLYIGTGLVLNAYAGDMKNPAQMHGFGKSIALQGIGLLLFDGTMYAMHQKQDKKWYKLMQGICFTGNGIGYRYAFN